MDFKQNFYPFFVDNESISFHSIFHTSIMKTVYLLSKPFNILYFLFFWYFFNARAMSQLICYSPNSNYGNISLWRPFWYNHFPSKVDWLFTSVAGSLPLWSLIFSCLHNFFRIVGMGYPWDIHIIVKPPLKNKINTATFTYILPCYGVPGIRFNLITHLLERNHCEGAF